jgi:iron-sulfur cluster repair protein YtfE (RIC family)
MSHSQIVFSPAATSILERTVGELVAERPGRSRIFQAANIDFCCQGNTYRALFAGLHELEKDLHRHIHLETSVLFPAAQGMPSSVKI